MASKNFTPAQLFRELARIHGRAQRVAVARRGASSTRCTILTELGRAGSVSVAELSARLKLDKGWVSRAVDKLVGDGAVRRVVDPADKRAVILSLTATGRKMHRELEEVLDQQIEAVFNGIPVEERARVASAMNVLLTAYLAEDPTGADVGAPPRPRGRSKKSAKRRS